MNVAITGADGFLGKAVVKQLKIKKIPYYAFDFRKHNLLKPKTLKSLVHGKDVIIHLAGVNRGDNIDLFKVNVLGTLSLLDAMAEYAPSSKVIFASTFQVYLKQSLYGLSKKVGEDLISQYREKTDLKGIILRISNIYGPGGKPFYNSVIATFAHLVKRGEVLKINSDGSQKRDYVYVDDVAEAIVKATSYSPKNSSEIIDICSGKETSLNRILKIIKQVSGKNFKVEYNKDVKEKPWPTRDKTFKKASLLLSWKPKTSLLKGLKAVMDYYEN